MDTTVSPLTQQSRPEYFQPKIVQLYEALFAETEDDAELSEGFWRELFLLSPDRSSLKRILDNLSAGELLDLQSTCQVLFQRAISEAQSGIHPRDANALETITVFLAAVLSKKFTNTSSDVIAILAGLDQVDHVISQFVTVIDSLIKNGYDVNLRTKAVEAALSMVSGAYQTGLVSYFTHRDLFPSLMKLINDTEAADQIFQPFLLLGLLASYNQFEFQNPYQSRLGDFVNENTIQKIVKCIGETCASSRNQFVAVQDDMPEGWSLQSTLKFLGLRMLAPGAKAPPPPSPEEAQELFKTLPNHEASILLATYNFTNANKLFGFNFVTSRTEKSTETPFAAFLSFSSYLLQHAHRSVRASQYAELTLFSLQILLEDQALCKYICSDESKCTIRLCRQRSPYLPFIGNDRILATAILDLATDTISHNLRRRLDIALYTLSLRLLHRLIAHLARSKTRLAHHWSELWRTLLSLIKFLTQYSTGLSLNWQTRPGVIDPLCNLIAFCLTAGDNFLPDPASFDDLFYKLVETGDILTKFAEAYSIPIKNSTSAKTPASNTSSASVPSSTPTASSSLPILISISSHYHDLLSSNNPAYKSRNLAPQQVQEVIRSGYETLSIEAPRGLMDSGIVGWREGEWKGEIKKVGKGVVGDVREWVGAEKAKNGGLMIYD